VTANDYYNHYNRSERTRERLTSCHRSQLRRQEPLLSNQIE